MKNQETRSGETRSSYLDMSYSDLVANYAQISSEVYISKPEDGQLWHSKGSWAGKGSAYFPIYIDSVPSEGDKPGIAFTDDYQAGGHGRHKVLVAITDSAVDNGSKPPLHQDRAIRLKVKVREFYASATDDAGGEGEWYMDHISGYCQQDQTVHKSELVENPERAKGEVATGALSGFVKTLNYQLQDIIIYPNCAGAFVTRPFEKDNDRPGETDFNMTVTDWLGVMWDIGKMLVAKKFKDFALDVIGAFKEVVGDAKDDDDLMNPAATVVTHSGASRLIWIYGQNNTFTIYREVMGLKATRYRINHAPDGWGSPTYVVIYESDPNRTCRITYDCKVALF